MVIVALRCGGDICSHKRFLTSTLKTSCSEIGTAKGRWERSEEIQYGRDKKGKRWSKLNKTPKIILLQPCGPSKMVCGNSICIDTRQTATQTPTFDVVAETIDIRHSVF